MNHSESCWTNVWLRLIQLCAPHSGEKESMYNQADKAEPVQARRDPYVTRIPCWSWKNWSKPRGRDVAWHLFGSTLNVTPFSGQWTQWTTVSRSSPSLLGSETTAINAQSRAKERHVCNTTSGQSVSRRYKEGATAMSKEVGLYPMMTTFAFGQLKRQDTSVSLARQYNQTTPSSRHCHSLNLSNFFSSLEFTWVWHWVLSLAGAERRWSQDLSSKHIRKDQVRATDKEGRDAGKVSTLHYLTL